jgi:Skp family chaperone for outer membrane proteins
MPRRPLTLAVIGIASLAMLAGAARTILGLPTRPPIVATVDLERLFNNLDLRQSGEDRVAALGGQFDKQLEELRGRIESLQADLENFEQGGEDWLRINDTVQSTISEYRAVEQYAQLKIEAERSKAMKSVYEAIKSEITSFAAAQTPPIDFVLIDDTVPELEPSTADAMLKQISARRMVYATKQFDITDAVLTRMNGRGG